MHPRSFTRGIAKSFLHFIGLRGLPTTSRIIPRCRKTKNSHACSAWRTPCSAAAMSPPRRMPLRRSFGQTRACAPPRPGPPDGLPHGRHQAPVSGLGRSDRLLHLFGDARRPFRPRRPWRKPRDMARKRRALCRAADHQSSAGLRRGLPDNSTASIFHSMRSIAHGLTVDALAADKASPELRQCLQDLAQRTSALLHDAEPFSAQISDLRLGLEVSVIDRLALKLVAMLMARDPLSERVHLNAAEVAGISASALPGPWPPHRAAIRDRQQSPADVRIGVTAVEPTLKTRQSAPRAARSISACGCCRRCSAQAVFEIYSFCRAVDDVADDPGPRDTRLAELQQWRADVVRAFRRRAAVAAAGSRRCPSATSRLTATTFLPSSMAWKWMSFPTSALPIGQRSIFIATGWRVPSGAFASGCLAWAGRRARLAHHLGRALQLTNILRDIDEDAEIGRLYLPREALSQQGIMATDPASVLSHPGLGAACGLVAERARHHFEHADDIMTALSASDRTHAEGDGGGLQGEARQSERARLVAAPPVRSRSAACNCCGSLARYAVI